MSLDPALKAFLGDPRNMVRRPPSHVPIEKVRALANAAMPRGAGPDLDGVTGFEARLPGRSIRTRLYRPAAARNLPLTIFAHGGGWVWGNLDTHDTVCRRLARYSGAAVLAVDYRLAPETRHSAQVDDVFDILMWALDREDILGIDANSVSLCGDSAGGALALSAALRGTEAGIPLRHLAMIYPALDPACGSASQLAFAEGYMLTRDAMRWFWECSYGGDLSGAPAMIVTEQLGRLPPVTLAVAEFDILRDEGEVFAARLADAGVPVRLRRYEGMIHGFLSVAAVAPVAERAIREIAADIAQELSGSREEIWR